MQVIPEALRPYLGTWVNTNEDTAFLYCFSLDVNEGALVLRTAHVHTDELGEAEIEVFAFKQNDAAFGARYSLDGQDVEIAAFPNLGLFVVAAYVEDLASPGDNELHREFYVPFKEAGDAV